MNRVQQTTASLEPNWGDWHRQRVSVIPRMVLDWLKDEGSLTKRLIQHSPGKFQVRLLRQDWGKALYSEQLQLGIRRGERAMIREVALCSDATPWVFARSLIPATSLRGSARRLAHLGEKPLGAILFADRNVHRGETQIARILPRHPLFTSATHHLEQKPKELWGRRTLFYIADKPLLVNEVFLPAIPAFALSQHD